MGVAEAFHAHALPASEIDWLLLHYDVAPNLQRMPIRHVDDDEILEQQDPRLVLQTRRHQGIILVAADHNLAHRATGEYTSCSRSSKIPHRSFTLRIVEEYQQHHNATEVLQAAEEGVDWALLGQDMAPAILRAWVCLIELMHGWQYARKELWGVNSAFVLQF